MYYKKSEIKAYLRNWGFRPINYWSHDWDRSKHPLLWSNKDQTHYIIIDIENKLWAEV